MSTNPAWKKNHRFKVQILRSDRPNSIARITPGLNDVVFQSVDCTLCTHPENTVFRNIKDKWMRQAKRFDSGNSRLCGVVANDSVEYRLAMFEAILTDLAHHGASFFEIKQETSVPQETDKSSVYYIPIALGTILDKCHEIRLCKKPKGAATTDAAVAACATSKSTSTITGRLQFQGIGTSNAMTNHGGIDSGARSESGSGAGHATSATTANVANAEEVAQNDDPAASSLVCHETMPRQLCNDTVVAAAEVKTTVVPIAAARERDNLVNDVRPTATATTTTFTVLQSVQTDQYDVSYMAVNMHYTPLEHILLGGGAQRHHFANLLRAMLPKGSILTFTKVAHSARMASIVGDGDVQCWINANDDGIQQQYYRPSQTQTLRHSNIRSITESEFDEHLGQFQHFYLFQKTRSLQSCRGRHSMSSSSTETEGSLVPEHREILKASSRLLSLHPGQYVNQEPERVVNEEASGAHNKRQKCTQVLPHKSDHAVGENDKAMETCKPTGRLKINTMSATNELDFCGHEEPPQVAAATTMTRAPDHSSVTIATTTAEGNEETSSRASLNDLQLATATTTLTTTTTTEPSPSEVIFLDLTKRAITECKELGALHADCRVLLQKVQSFHIDCRAVEKDMEESMGPWLLQKACNDVLESNDVVPHEAGRDRVHVQSTDLPDLITMPSIGDADTNRLTILGAFLDEAAQQKRVLADTRNVLTAEIERQKALLRQVKLECKELQSEYQVLSNKWKVIQRKLRSEAS